MKTPLLTLTLLLTGLTGLALADDGHWLVRGRVIDVLPANDGGKASIGGKPHANGDLVPEIDLTYFATPNWGVELIAATTSHKITVNKRPSTVDLGKVWLLPPTLTAQYHLPLGDWKPYVGAGVTYAHFYDAEHPGFGSVKYDDSWGAAFQAGVDYKVAEHWVVNADVKKILLSTDVTVNNTITAKANLNPLIAGVGVGYRF